MGMIKVLITQIKLGQIMTNLLYLLKLKVGINETHSKTFIVFLKAIKTISTLDKIRLIKIHLINYDHHKNIV